MQEVKKIVIIGPESTGKSTLCQQLADHYNTLWCKEYAREYLLEHGTRYCYDDLLTIAKGQLASERECENKLREENPETKDENSSPPPTTNYEPPTLKSQPLLFIDTNMYVMKVWCEYVFNKCHTFILDKIVEQTCDLYLLCNVDLPWVKDELREYPDLASRRELYHIYKDILVNQQVPWVDISGNYAKRFETAVGAVDELLTSS